MHLGVTSHDTRPAKELIKWSSDLCDEQGLSLKMARTDYPWQETKSVPRSIARACMVHGATIGEKHFVRTATRDLFCYAVGLHRRMPLSVSFTVGTRSLIPFRG